MIIDILNKFAKYPSHVSDIEHIICNGHHETGAVDNGIIRPTTKWADVDAYEEIYKGPQFNIGNPLAKNARNVCNAASDYDVIDLEAIGDLFVQRTNFVPALPLSQYKSLIKGFQIGQDKDGLPIYENWMDEYKVTMRCMLNISQERTLICAVLPRKTAHIHAVISVSFRDGYNCVDMAAFCESIPLDFYLKTIGLGQIAKVLLESFPLGVPSQYTNPLRVRTLRLNCVTNRYADLWQEVWNPAYTQEQWSIDDERLAPWNILTEEWNHDTPLRNYFERRMALVEIDVLAAMVLGLTLDELIMMYEIQFPVLQQNENDTWYDRHGRIVFTCSKGLIGVGIDRPTWNRIREMRPGESYTHTLTSELYAGQTITYEAPFTCCDRIQDYRTAWAHFEKIFKN